MIRRTFIRSLGVALVAAYARAIPMAPEPEAIDYGLPDVDGEGIISAEWATSAMDIMGDLEAARQDIVNRTGYYTPPRVYTGPGVTREHLRALGLAP